MEDFLSAALLFLFLGGALFSWIDWRRRARRLPKLAGLSWSCPNCTMINEAGSAICWSCGAGIAGRVFLAGRTMAADSWQCALCHAWNGKARRKCWSCATAPPSPPKRAA